MQPPVLNVENIAVFLDFDGTLVDFAPTPEAVVVSADLKDLLNQLNHALDGALALVTGRSLTSLDGLLGDHPLCVAGCHGAEWRLVPIAGGESSSGSASHDSAALAAAARALTEFADRHQLILENKPHSLALHFRNRPELQAQVDAWLDDVIVPIEGLRLIKGKAVREVQLAGVHKGVAVERFMQQSPFKGRTPVYVGDDVTDEDAFTWVNSVRGLSIKVGDGPTVAEHHLPDFRAVALWLQSLLSGDGETR